MSETTPFKSAVTLLETRHTAPAHFVDKEHAMNNIIWIVGAVVIVLIILGFFGLR